MELVATVVLFFSSVLWGLAWLPLKYLHEMGFDGIPLTLFLYTIMLVVILPWIWRKRSEIRPSWKILLAIGVLGGGAQLAFNTAMIYGEVIRVMVLFYLLPVWGVIGGRLFLGEAIDRVRWLGLGLAVSGAFLVVGGWKALESPPSWIDALALLSGFLFAMNNIAFRVSPKVDVSLKLAFMFGGSVLMASGVIQVMSLPAWPDVSLQAWGILFLFGAVWMMLANLGTQWAVTHMEAGRSSIIIIMELVTAVLSASILLNETMSPTEMVGGLLIVVAAFLEARRANGH